MVAYGAFHGALAKDQLPIPNVPFFISDDAEAFFGYCFFVIVYVICFLIIFFSAAWTNVFQGDTEHLLCLWHVDKRFTANVPSKCNQNKEVRKIIFIFQFKKVRNEKCRFMSRS